MSTSDRPYTARALAKKLASGEETSVSLVNQALKRIEDYDDPTIFISMTPEEALQEARQSDIRRAQGQPLSSWDGVPMAWKDLFDIKGSTTTAGSLVFADAQTAMKDAPVVAHCRAAGLISVGKTNLSEFAYSGLGLNPHYGTPINPRSTSDPKVSGGSSSGSAAAVAAGLVPLAIGTDTAGSVRVPASFCGVFGFKPSQMHYDRSGVFPLSVSLDSVGTFANDLGDLIILDRILRGVEIKEEVRSDSVPPNLIIPDNIVFEDMHSDVANVFETSVKHLQSKGVSITRTKVPIFDEVVALAKKHGTLTAAEAATYHKETLESPKAEQLDEIIKKRLLSAYKYTAQDYIRLQWERARLQDEMYSYLNGDILYFPTVPIPAPSIAELEADHSLFTVTNLLALRNTVIGSFLGMPGINIPIGKTRYGLPIGGLFSAAHAQDEFLLAKGRTISSLLSNDIVEQG